MAKAVLVICDGLPDRPIAELGNKTPLEVARTPNLDRLAVDGISGMMHTIDVGVRPGSDTAHLALFGYDPKKYYLGRGPFECLGIEMDITSADVALRANAATLDEQGNILDRRAGRISSTKEIIDFLGSEIEIKGVKFMLKPGLSHRIGLVLRGEGISHMVSNLDHKEIGIAPNKVAPLDDSREAKFTAEILNDFYQIVSGKMANTDFNKKRQEQGLLPANTILFRGAGKLPPDLPKFSQKYSLQSAVIAGGPLYRGIAKAIGMDIIYFSPEEGITGKPDSNINLKIKKAVELLDEGYNFIFVHIKAADNLAEDGNFRGKVEFIEKMDKAFSPLIARPDVLTVVTADHTTSSILKKHTADPVPITFRGPGIRTDDLNAYSERESAKGRLGHIRGRDLMPLLTDFLGKSEMYGA